MNTDQRAFYEHGRQMHREGKPPPRHDGSRRQCWLVAGWHDEDMESGENRYRRYAK